MTDFFGYLPPSEVKDSKSFATYCQQELGTPFPSQKNMPALRRQIKEFFERYPNADYYSLCRIVDWAKSRKKRLAHAHVVVASFRYAWADGFLPELDPSKQTVDAGLEDRIKSALEVETHPFWRERLMGAEGVKARTAVYDAWKEQRPINA